MSDIILTVGLPMFRALRIGWLALESLCRQVNATAFGWELVIAEEQDYEPMGEQAIIGTYGQRLTAAGCVRVTYIPLDEWIPLSWKWCRIVQRADPVSQIFVFQGADDFAHSHHLENTVRNFDRTRASWVQSRRWLLYDLANDRAATLTIMDRPTRPGFSARLHLVRGLPMDVVVRGVDQWLFARCLDAETVFKVFTDRSDSWRESLYVRGANALSDRDVPAGEQYDGGAIFKPHDMALVERSVPPEIMRRLRAVEPSPHGLIREFIPSRTGGTEGELTKESRVSFETMPNIGMVGGRVFIIGERDREAVSA